MEDIHSKTDARPVETSVPVSLTESEFSSLRQTIAVRGTVRMVLLPVTLLGWSALGTILFLYSDLPIASLLSLAVLVGGFEAIHALHVGAERIGRYVQVYYEASSEAPQWETTAMAVGPSLPGGGVDPLFTVVFVCAALVNVVAGLLPQPTPLELGVVLALHALFVVRVVRARIAAARQRAVELESFRAIRSRDAYPKA